MLTPREHIKTWVGGPDRKAGSWLCHLGAEFEHVGVEPDVGLLRAGFYACLLECRHKPLGCEAVAVGFVFPDVHDVQGAVGLSDDVGEAAAGGWGPSTSATA